MIRLKPEPDNIFTCPECNATYPFINRFTFESINMYASCTCKNCDFEFVQIVPVGHSVGYSLSFGRNNKKFYKSIDCPDWLSTSIMKSYMEIRERNVSIERIIYKECEQVVILNTLDSLYGHVLLKLYNTIHHLNHDKEIGLIIIIPKIFTWLIPAGCAEVWIVDLKLSELIYGYPSIRKFVSDRLEQFKVVYLSNAFSHPSINNLDIERFTGVIPFSIDNYVTQKPVITFILREDRWWFNGLMDYWFYRVCRKLKVIRLGSRVLTWRQNQLVRKTIRAIKRDLHEVNVYIIGLGCAVNDGLSHDLRKSTITSEIEKEWCRIYAMSHIVIGIHGSNMLLPTALAAGCIEILPEDRYGNIVQDISVRYNNRMQLYFYRFVDQFSKPKAIADKAVSMINDYSIFNRNMILHTY